MSEELIETIKNLDDGELSKLLGEWIGRRYPNWLYGTLAAIVRDGFPQFVLPIIPAPGPESASSPPQPSSL